MTSRKHPIPLKNLYNLFSELKIDSETEKENYKQGLVQKLYIHISLKVKVLWKTRSTEQAAETQGKDHNPKGNKVVTEVFMMYVNCTEDIFQKSSEKKKAE